MEKTRDILLERQSFHWSGIIEWIVGVLFYFILHSQQLMPFFYQYRGLVLTNYPKHSVQPSKYFCYPVRSTLSSGWFVILHFLN